jgi:hypothetical protein
LDNYFFGIKTINSINTHNYHNVVISACMSINIQRINELDERIKDFLIKDPNRTQQIIDNVADRGKSALVKQNADLITAVECLIVTRLLRDLSVRD